MKIWALKLLNVPQQGRGNILFSRVDDLDLIGDAFGISKIELFSREILIQMRRIEVYWSVASGYVQATYDVLDPSTNIQKTGIKGHMFGRNILDSAFIGDKIDFVDGEYIKELTAYYDPISCIVSGIKIITNNPNKSLSTATIIPLLKNISLKNIACLTGRPSLLHCGGLGAWSGQNLVPRYISANGLLQFDTFNSYPIYTNNLGRFYVRNVSNASDQYREITWNNSISYWDYVAGQTWQNQIQQNP